MDTCIYEIDYEYRSRLSLAFDESHVRALVEAPKGISKDQLEKLCHQKIQGFAWLNGFHKACVIKLT